MTNPNPAPYILEAANAVRYAQNGQRVFLATSDRNTVGTPVASDMILSDGLTVGFDRPTETIDFQGNASFRDGANPQTDSMFTVGGSIISPIYKGLPTSATPPNHKTLLEVAGFTYTQPDTQTAVVTFGALTASQAITIAGLTFTATANVSASDLAAVYAELTAGSLGGSGTATTEGGFTGALALWNTGSVGGVGSNVVTFTSTTANSAVADLITTATTGVAYTVVNNPSYWLASNSSLNPQTGTAVFAESTLDRADVKTYLGSNCIATVDMNFKIGAVAKTKFNLKGTAAQLPVQASDYTFSPGTQDNLLYWIPVVSHTTVETFDIQVMQSDGTYYDYAMGNLAANFYELDAPNTSGIDGERYLTAQESGYTKFGKSDQVSVTILAPSAQATNNVYIPEGLLQQFHRILLRITNPATGNMFSIEFDKLQLTGAADVEIGRLKGQKLTFQNRGYTYLKYW
jgi:hypothetical protein